MEQVTFADVEYEGKKRRTRRELFLERMEALIPWERLEARIRPLYPKAGRGRQPYPLAAMLRIHCVQLFYNLSDPGMEDMLYEIESVRRFARLRLTGPLPDETTILNFRHLLERHGLGVVCSRRSTRTWRSGATGCGRGRSWTRASSRRRHRRRTGRGRGIRRCIRRGRATSGTSG